MNSKPSSAIDPSEADIMEHEEKVNNYEAMYAGRLKAKYFSKKTFNGEDVFDTEVLIENETIKSSRWPCMRSFADPAKHLGEQNQSLPSAEELSVAPTKNQASKKTS
uniref:Uncharacterized protein n=1 Tax=Ananas comosus var. bracteatus TaxID=296719 RepID=A0A6V7P218_ANACO|nr:unnamed protein product [Ananas comosus var. bracteatus]